MASTRNIHNVQHRMTPLEYHGSGYDSRYPANSINEFPFCVDCSRYRATVNENWIIDTRQHEYEFLLDIECKMSYFSLEAKHLSSFMLKVSSESSERQKFQNEIIIIKI